MPYDQSLPVELLTVPTVSAVTPASVDLADPDTEITITGDGLSEYSEIIFNGGPEPTTFVPPDTVTTIVRPSTASGPAIVPVQVRNGVQLSEPVDFEFTGTAPAPPAVAAGGYDPGAHTVEEVKAYVAEHPDERQAVYDAEAAGKARVTLLEALSAGEEQPPG